MPFNNQDESRGNDPASTSTSAQDCEAQPEVISQTRSSTAVSEASSNDSHAIELDEKAWFWDDWREEDTSRHMPGTDDRPPSSAEDRRTSETPPPDEYPSSVCGFLSWANAAQTQRVRAHHDTRSEKSNKTSNKIEALIDQAIHSKHKDLLCEVLHRHFRNGDKVVDLGEYQWISELIMLELTIGEIVDEIIQVDPVPPWICNASRDVSNGHATPLSCDLHIKNCAHQSYRIGQAGSVDKASLFTTKLYQDAAHSHSPNPTARDSKAIGRDVRRLCAVPAAGSPSVGRGCGCEYDFVLSEKGANVAIALDKYSSLDQYWPPNAHTFLSSTFERLVHAACHLQQNDGCCDSFTVATRLNSVIELHRVSLRTIRALNEHWSGKENGNERKTVASWSDFASLTELPTSLLHIIEPIFEASDKRGLTEHFFVLIAQFLSFAFLSYSQAHCGPLDLPWLDRPVSKILLLGIASDFGIHGPTVQGLLADLTCFGGMLGQPIFVFEFHRTFEGRPPVERLRNFDLLATPEDVLDTWGPGGYLMAPNDTGKILGVAIGKGWISAITSSHATALDKKSVHKITQLHWAPRDLGPQFSIAFEPCQKMLIGANIRENMACKTNIRKQIEEVSHLFTELGTFPTSWEVAERQLGIGGQAGEGLIGILQLSQTWHRRPGVTKKERMLVPGFFNKTDLDGYFGVQVSICTGIARRVRLRNLIADVLPALVSGMITTPALWKSLLSQYDILTNLRNGDLSEWLNGLDHEHQRTFQELSLAVLTVLQDTGYDNKREYLTVGRIQEGLPLRGFRIHSKNENCWVRLLADCEELATFAYFTGDCLHTVDHGCGSSAAACLSSTPALDTAVFCCDEGTTTTPRPKPADQAPSTSPHPVSLRITKKRWALKHSEGYLIEKVDKVLFVRVDQPDPSQEPRIMVSASKTPEPIMRRLLSKARLRKSQFLKERKELDQVSQSVLVIANRD